MMKKKKCGSKFIKVRDIEHLKELATGGAEFIMQLNFGCMSSKHIEFKNGKFYIINYIDDSEQILTPLEIKDESNTLIGTAIYAGAFWQDGGKKWNTLKR